jgi:TP901 family phage tail tape measure protein
MAKNIVLKISQKGAKKTLSGVKSLSSGLANMSKASAVAGVGVGILSVKLAGDFQKSLLEVSTLMKNVNENTLPRMSRELRVVASSSGLALSSISKAKYDIVSAGFSNAAASAEILNASAQLAVGGVTSAAAAADLLTTSLNAYGLESSDVDRIADSLFTTVRLGKTTMDELASSLGQVLPFAKSANISFENVGAAMATLTSSGVKTSEATTALRTAITSLTAPTDTAKRAMAEAGIEVKTFDDGTVDLVSTIAQFEGLDPDTLKKLIPSETASLGIQVMSNNLDVLRSNVEQFGDGIDDTDTAFKKMSKSFNMQMSKMKNNAQSIMIEIGNVIIDSIQPAVEAANRELTKLGEIGFDNLAIAIQVELPMILDTMQSIFNIVMKNIEARLKVFNVKLMDAFNPFATEAPEKMRKMQESVEKSWALSSEIIGILTQRMYDRIIVKAEETAAKETAIITTSNDKKLELKTAEVENEIEAVTAKKELIDLEQFARKQLETDQALQLEKYQAMNVSKAESDKIFTKQMLNLETAQRNAKAATVGSFLSLAKQASSENKNMGQVTKRLAQGEAIVSTYQAANKAFAQFGGFPGGVLPAAASVVIGLANVAEIEKTEFAEGGIVPGTGNRDTVPAMLTPGEVILNQAQQDNLVSNMGFTVNISGNVIGNEEFVRETLIPEIQRGISLA